MSISKRVIWYFPGLDRGGDVLDVDVFPGFTCEGVYLAGGIVLRFGPRCVLIEVELLGPAKMGFDKVAKLVLEKFEDIEHIVYPEEVRKDIVKSKEELEQEARECFEHACPDEYLLLEDDTDLVDLHNIIQYNPNTDTFIINIRTSKIARAEESPLGVKLYRDHKGRIARIEVPEATKKGLLQAVYRYIVREVETEQ